MSFLEKISAEFKAAAAVLVPFSAWGGNGGGASAPYWSSGGWNTGPGGGGAKYDYRAAAGDLWENSTVAACINALSQAFSTAPPILEKRTGTDWKQVDHDLINVLNKPNGYYGAEHLWTATVGSECINGTGFWRIRMNRVGTPAEIWWEPYAEPKYDRTSFISDYILRVDGNPIPVPAAAGYDGKNKATDLMVHFRHALHPKNPRWGWTPLSTALRHVAGDNGVASYHASLLRNSAVPSGFVSPPPATQGAPQAPVSPDQLKELLERLERKLTGEGAGRIAGMTLPLLYSRVGFSPDEMAIPDLLAYYQSHICAALNVPMMLLGFSGGESTKTYSNYGECIEDFWRRTIIPSQERHGSEIESQLFPLFGLDRDEYRLSWDRSKVAALQDDESQLYDRMQKASGGPFLTPNEVRKSLGKGDIEGGDELRSAAPLMPDNGGEAVNPFSPKAQKSFFLKLVDANGMSHGDDGKFDGGSGSIEVNLPTQHPNMLKGDGMPEEEIPKIALGEDQRKTVKNVIAHLRDVWAKPGIFEKGVVVTKDNEIIQSQSKERESTSVKLNADQMEGAMLLHSHPIDLPPGSIDIQTFLNNPLKETVIVTTKHTYTLSKPDSWENKWKTAPVNKTFTDMIKDNLMQKGYTESESLRILNDSADGNYRGELLSKNANEAQLEAVKETARIMGLKFAVSKK